VYDFERSFISEKKTKKKKTNNKNQLIQTLDHVVQQKGLLIICCSVADKQQSHCVFRLMTCKLYLTVNIYHLTKKTTRITVSLFTRKPNRFICTLLMIYTTYHSTLIIKNNM